MFLSNPGAVFLFSSYKLHLYLRITLKFCPHYDRRAEEPLAFPKSLFTLTQVKASAGGRCFGSRYISHKCVQSERAGRNKFLAYALSYHEPIFFIHGTAHYACRATIICNLECRNFLDLTQVDPCNFVYVRFMYFVRCIL